MFEDGQTVWIRGTVVHGNEDWTAVKLSSDVACEAPDTLCVENEDLMAEADLASGIAHVVRDAYDPLHSYERYRLPVTPGDQVPISVRKVATTFPGEGLGGGGDGLAPHCCQAGKEAYPNACPWHGAKR